MFYTDASGAYMVDSVGTCNAIGLTAKDKVVERREIESLAVVKGKACDLPPGAVPASLDEIAAKFNVSEANPLAAPQEPEEEEDDAVEAALAGPVDPDAHTKAELEGMASELGVELPAKATKAEIAALINGK